MADFTGFVLDDDDNVREYIARELQRRGISIKAYSTAEELLANLFPSAVLELSEMPDFLIVDLQLKEGQMQGTDLIKKLAERDIPSQILAISGFIPSCRFTDEMICFGTSVLLSKPFDMSALCSRAMNLAQIGYNKRMKRIRDIEKRFHPRDNKRMHRPVFLSYANKDKMLANGIRIQIESYGINVWYAPTTLDVGHEWRKEIERGIDDACIFISILSDNFIESEICLKEMDRFRGYLQEDSDHPSLFLPVIADLSLAGQSHKLVQWIKDTYQCLYIKPRIADCITALIMRIQVYLAQKAALSC